MLTILLTALVIALIVLILCHVANLVVKTQPFNNIVKAILIVVGLLVFLQQVGWLGGLA